ncbi:MAG: sterol desaturase family protein [Flavisolibacter sp.]
MKKRLNLPQWLCRFLEDYPNFPTVFSVIGFIAIILLLNLQLDLIKISKSELMLDGDSLFGRTFLHCLIDLRDLYHELPVFIRELVWSLYKNCLYFIVPFILLFEYLVPSRPEQAVLSAGFLQDAIWFVVRSLLDPLLLGPAFIFFEAVYHDNLSFLTIQTTSSWPLPLQILLAVVFSDFLSWVSHVIVHKNPVLWAFHAVHHSQEQMNVFTDDRGHPVDILFRGTINFIPFLIFDPALSMLASITVLRGAMQRFIHSNVQIDFGLFNYVLVSPQFHCVHHSKEDPHRDKNFGTLFSVWDHLFGTAYPDPSEYPATGIADSAFPYEGRVRKTRLMFNVCRQITYPFEQLFRGGHYQRGNAKDA